VKRIAVFILLLAFDGSARAQDEHLLTATTSKSFPEAMTVLQDAIVSQGYKVTRVQRVDVGLGKAGYTSAKYRVVFYGKPTEVRHILAQSPEAASFVPLAIAIYEDGSAVKFVAERYSLLHDAPEAKGISQYLDRWESDTRRILGKAQAAN
jgi:uncharacterized protein (DUF302 family)